MKRYEPSLYFILVNIIYVGFTFFITLYIQIHYPSRKVVLAAKTQLVVKIERRIKIIFLIFVALNTICGVALLSLLGLLIGLLLILSFPVYAQDLPGKESEEGNWNLQGISVFHLTKAI